MTMTVTMAAAVRCTMFVPMRIVVIARSKSSSTRMARLARLSPFSCPARMRARETEAKAGRLNSELDAATRENRQLKAEKAKLQDDLEKIRRQQRVDALRDI